jgi:single-strand DNA-binding protein
MFQQITIVGNVGNDSEQRYTPSGDAVTSFNVAVTETWTKDGEKHEKVTWHRVTCWRKLAEITGEYVKKGMRVLVVGTVEARPWTDKSGTNRASLEVTAQTIRFLGARGDTQSATHDAQDATGEAQADEDVPW